MKKIRVAVIGVGNMGQHHVRVYSRLPNVHLVGVCDVDVKRARNVGQKYNCLYSNDYHKLLTTEKIDAVSVVVPTFFHCKIACDVLNMGVNVLLEKPIATKISDATKIIDTATGNKKILMVGHIERFNPAVIELKKLISKGTLGQIISINIKRVGGMPFLVKSTNVILDLAIHDIDIANFLLNERPLSIYGIKSKNLIRDQEDSAVLLLKYKTASVFIEVNWVTPVKIRTLDITGSKAFARLDYIKQSLIIYENNQINKFSHKYTSFNEFISQSNPIKINIEVKKEEPLKSEIESFVDCVLHNRAPQITGADAYKALEVALKI